MADANQPTTSPSIFATGAFGVDLLRSRNASISVCLPALNEADSIGPLVESLVGMRDEDLIDQVLVVDGGSSDSTVVVANALGAQVFSAADLFPECGPVRGKGDSMWRGLKTCEGEIVCFLDADLHSFTPAYVAMLVGPLLTNSQFQFVKGTFERPLNTADGPVPNEGGRVTEVLARPMLRALLPELPPFRQPLSGQIAARRSLLIKLPMLTGYAIDVALLIDAWTTAGTSAIAEVDLGVLTTRHQSLSDLRPVADDVVAGISLRLEGMGRLAPATTTVPPRVVERPPHIEIAAESNV
jgi:glucosyl-3-phosphoglycerate synthase